MNEELEDGWSEYITTLVDGDVEFVRKLEDQLLMFRNNISMFGRPTALLHDTQLQPVSWWEKYGISTPELVGNRGLVYFSHAVLLYSFCVCFAEYSIFFAETHSHQSVVTGLQFGPL